MWFIGVEVVEQEQVHPLIKKILDPPLPLVMSQVVQLMWCHSHSTGHYWGVNVLFSVGSERNPHSQGS